MVQKGRGKVKGKALCGHAGTTRRMSKLLHPTHRLWSQLPASLMVSILASLPGKHRRSRITLAHMTLAEVWQELKKVLDINNHQRLSGRDTQQVILDAIIQSYTLQNIPVPSV